MICGKKAGCKKKAHQIIKSSSAKGFKYKNTSHPAIVWGK